MKDKLEIIRETTTLLEKQVALCTAYMLSSKGSLGEDISALNDSVSGLIIGVNSLMFNCYVDIYEEIKEYDSEEEITTHTLRVSSLDSDYEGTDEEDTE